MTLLTTATLIALCAPSLFAAGEGKTFSTDVWPIVERRCVTCHRMGEIAPMAFTSYGQVRPWASAIREAVLSGTMPPWHAAQGKHTFRNDRSLSKAEVATLVAWVDGGAPEGTPLTKASHDTGYREAGPGWKLGVPDVVVEVPGFPVPKSGSLPYSFLIVPLHLERDTWVRAAEFQIEHRAVIHHINAFVKRPESSYLAGFPEGRIFVPTIAERAKRRDGEGVFERRELLLGYEPGYEPAPWLEDGAKLVKAGSSLVLEMHYNPNGKEMTDHSKLALYFAKSAPLKRILAIDTLRDLDLQIPPQEGNYLSSASITLSAPATLLSLQPHMHMRGKSMEVRAIYPDGRTEELIHVPHYNFQWQTTYALNDPVMLPAGTRLESRARFDNSVNNSFNPDPTALVHWGDQTTDEMHIAFLELVIGADADAEGLLRDRPRMIGTPVKSR